MAASHWAFGDHGRFKVGGAVEQVKSFKLLPKIESSFHQRRGRGPPGRWGDSFFPRRLCPFSRRPAAALMRPRLRFAAAMSTLRAGQAEMERSRTPLLAFWARVREAKRSEGTFGRYVVGDTWTSVSLNDAGFMSGRLNNPESSVSLSGFRVQC